ncbi:dTDP-4-dehydrorhamnose reductase [Candidatus Uhrbacteria bacterium]|nr:dTDP-4-dehydrorhamnose reductase [Candidatus Uhrbacteria bacterium]
MKILLTGAGGTLANAFERILASSPHHTAVFFSKAECDITILESIESALEHAKPDVLINTAAYNAVDRAEQESDAAMRLNARAVALLARACQVRDILLVHYSTDYVFDGDNPNGYSEEDEPNPLSSYGQSKREGEQALMGEAGLRYYCIRTSRLFGPRGSSIGSKPSFPQIVVERLLKGETVRLIDAEVSSPTYSDDLASASLDMIEKKYPGGIYHRTNDGSCNWYEFGCTVAEGLKARGKAVPMIERALVDSLKREARRPAVSILRTTKLPPLRSWQEALSEYLETV